MTAGRSARKKNITIELITEPARPRWSAAVRWLFLIIILVVAAGGLLAPPRASAAPIVSAVSGDLDGGIARLIVTVDRPVTHRVFTLADPHRVVIDLPAVAWRSPSASMPHAIGVVGRVRHGSFSPTTHRIVVDCTAAPTVVNATMVPAPDGTGHQLVVDLAAAGWSRAMQPAPAAVAPLARPPLAVDTIGQTVLPPPPPRPWATSERIIVLDPGHGGKDPGAVGVSGVHEKTITLATARHVRAELKKLGRYRVMLTRDGDSFIRLRDRVAIARSVGAELFVSIHADALDATSVRGSSVYTLSEKASDAEAAALAERENKADLIAGVNLVDEAPDVATILIDLAQRETMNQSIRLARSVASEIGRSSRLLRRHHRFAGFAVLKAPDIPSILIELGFLSNASDEALLRRDSHQRQLARAIARGIHRYFADVQEARLN